MEFILQLNC